MFQRLCIIYQRWFKKPANKIRAGQIRKYLQYLCIYASESYTFYSIYTKRLKEKRSQRNKRKSESSRSLYPAQGCHNPSSVSTICEHDSVYLTSECLRGIVYMWEWDMGWDMGANRCMLTVERDLQAMLWKISLGSLSDRCVSEHGYVPWDLSL